MTQMDVRRRTVEGNAKLFTHCQLKEVFIKLKQVLRIDRELKEMGPQADFVGERELSEIKQILNGCTQADGEVKSNICYWQKFNYGWHKPKTMCEVLSQCRMRHNG